MRRLIFAALVSGAAAASPPAWAQDVPARDLLDFPIGTVAEPAALAATVGDGLWNPATAHLAGPRARVGIGALSSSAQQGVTVQTAYVAALFPRATTVALSYVRAGVRDLQRTDTDPQTLGAISYGTAVASALVARRWAWLQAGLALRYRSGELEQRERGVLGIDGGAVARVRRLRDARLAVSSYLWRPGADDGDRPALAAATDLRLGGTSEARELRAGASLVATRALGNDGYLHVAGRSGRFALSAGVVRTRNWGLTTWGSRLGVGLHYARYVAAFSREENETGLPATYQFTLTSSFQ